jgi:16S rRNA (cytidine1402-2'-O)-methyltransferase
MSGRLFIVGTPIGNLGDITQRALDTLRHVTHVFAEDTRRSRALLTHFGIDGKKVLSLHAHSSERVLEVALEVLEAEHDVALVSDAGMPTVSDPGTELVRRARARGIRIEVIPGPSAVTSAVALSGLVVGPFCFLGFLARKGGARREQLLGVGRSKVPTVLFESPKRLDRTLHDLADICGAERRVAVCRELTKQFEETLVGTFEEVLESPREWRGEITLVVEPAAESTPDESELDLDQRIVELLGRGLSARDVTAELTSELQRAGQRLRKKDLYARVLTIHAADGDGDDEGDDDDHDRNEGDDDDSVDAPEKEGI